MLPATDGPGQDDEPGRPGQDQAFPRRRHHAKALRVADSDHGRAKSGRKRGASARLDGHTGASKKTATGVRGKIGQDRFPRQVKSHKRTAPPAADPAPSRAAAARHLGKRPACPRVPAAGHMQSFNCVTSKRKY